MTEARSLALILAELLLAIAMREPDPIEREEKLEILRRDGWLAREVECA